MPLGQACHRQQAQAPKAAHSQQAQDPAAATASGSRPQLPQQAGASTGSPVIRPAFEYATQKELKQVLLGLQTKDND